MLNPIEQVNLVTIGAMALIFTATFLILRKVFFVRVIEVMEKRSSKIEAAQERYAEARSTKESAGQEAERIVAEANAEAERMAEDSSREIAASRGSKIADANAEGDRILAKGREKIERLSEVEQAKLKESLLVCVEQTLEKFIGTVDKKAVRFVVDRVLATREGGE